MQAIQLKKQKEEAEKLANTPEAKKNKADGEAFLAKKAKETYGRACLLLQMPITYDKLL